MKQSTNQHYHDPSERRAKNSSSHAYVGVAATTPGPGVHAGFAGAAAAAAPPALAPASTSRATTRPPGPVPERADRSMPWAPAFFFARPEATTRPSDEAAGVLAPPGREGGVGGC